MKARVYTVLGIMTLLLNLSPTQAQESPGANLPPLAPPIRSLDSAIQDLTYSRQNQEIPAVQTAPVQSAPEHGSPVSQAAAPASAPVSANAPEASPAAESVLQQPSSNETVAPESLSQLQGKAGSQPNFKSPVVFIYEFTASWCPSCRKLAPVVEKAAAKYGGFVQYTPVDVDKNQELVKQLNVAQIPTLMVIDRRGRMLNRLVGLQQGAQIDTILDHYRQQTIASLSRKTH